MLAAFIAQPRGATIAKVGGLAPGAIGGRKMTQQRRAAEEGGLKLTTPMALALTDRRLVVFAVSQPIAMGKGGDVKQLFSARAPERRRLDRGQAPAGGQGRDRHRPGFLGQAGG